MMDPLIYIGHLNYFAIGDKNAYKNRYNHTTIQHYGESFLVMFKHV